MTEIGKMERPNAAGFKGARKLILVPLVYAGEGSPKDLIDLAERYWAGVRSSIESLESRLGMVNHVYHEVVAAVGDEGLAMMERVSKPSQELVKPRTGAGAVIEQFEDEEILAEYLDWQRCLSVGFMSNGVATKVSGFYSDAVKRRTEHLAKRIQDTLGPGEVGLLFISEDHKVQFPSDIEVFYVAPPALDELHRWLRDQRSRPPAAEDTENKTEA